MSGVFRGIFGSARAAVAGGGGPARLQIRSGGALATLLVPGDTYTIELAGPASDHQAQDGQPITILADGSASGQTLTAAGLRAGSALTVPSAVAVIQAQRGTILSQVVDIDLTAPVVAGSIADVEITAGLGVYEIPVAGLFTGDVTGYAISPAGSAVTYNDATASLIVSDAASLTATEFAVRALNADTQSAAITFSAAVLELATSDADGDGTLVTTGIGADVLDGTVISLTFSENGGADETTDTTVGALRAGPVFLRDPVISNDDADASGTLSVGDTLTIAAPITAGTGGEATVAYQWTLDAVDIVGATGLTYTVASGDAGKNVGARVVPADANGTATWTSAPLAVDLPPDPVVDFTAAAEYGSGDRVMTPITGGQNFGGHAADNTFRFVNWLTDIAMVSGATYRLSMVLNPDVVFSIVRMIASDHFAFSGTESLKVEIESSLTPGTPVTITRDFTWTGTERTAYIGISARTGTAGSIDIVNGSPTLQRLS